MTQFYTYKLLQSCFLFYDSNVAADSFNKNWPVGGRQAAGILSSSRVRPAAPT